MSAQCLHREDEVRECVECGAYLTSANEDNYCSLHGGWSVQRYLEQSRRDRAELFRELVAGEIAQAAA